VPPPVASTGGWGSSSRVDSRVSGWGRPGEHQVDDSWGANTGSRWELRLPQASKTESELVRSAINNQKITGLCGPMGNHKRPLWTVGAEGGC
jgi:hypothetical protein